MADQKGLSSALTSADARVNITVPENYNGTPIEVRILEGEAPKTFEYEKEQFKETVAINSIAEWVLNRHITTPIQDNRAVIMYCLNPDKPSIKYLEDVNDCNATLIDAKLTKNPDLALFKINTETSFSQAELKKLVLQKGYCFPEGEAQRFRQSLLNYEVKFEQTVIKQDDRQGTTKDLCEAVIKIISGTMPSQWKIKLPLYKSQPPVELTLLIEIEKMGTMPGFQFYCPELEGIMRQATEDIILTEVKKFDETHVCLELE